MSIKQLVEDARFLIANERKLSALALLLVAVAGSSRRKHPKPQTRNEPYATDREAFTHFLGGRIGQCIGAQDIFDACTRSGFLLVDGERQKDVETLIYESYRNSLIHEGALGDSACFHEAHAVQGIRFEIGGERWMHLAWVDGVLHFDQGLLDLLDQVVVNARCNAQEFGINHPDILAISRRDGDDGSIRQMLKADGLTTDEGITGYEWICEWLVKSNAAWANHVELGEIIREQVKQNTFNMGLMTHFRHLGVLDDDDGFSEQALLIIERVAKSFENKVVWSQNAGRVSQ